MLRLRLHRTGDVRLGRDVAIGRGARLDAAPGARIVVADGARIGARSRVEARAGEIVIGAGARLGEACVLVALGRIEVGAGAHLGEGAVLLDAAPEASDAERPVREQGVRTAPVRVGDRAVLGPGACVLAGVSVGEGARVIAHAVVEHDVAAGAVVESAGAAAQPRPLVPPVSPGARPRPSATRW